MDAAQRIFNTLSVVPLDPDGRRKQADYSEFYAFRQRDLDHRSGVRESVHRGESSRPHPLSYGHPSEPSRYLFYDTAGNPIAAESVVDITGDLEITEDGALTVQTEMELWEYSRSRPMGEGSWCRDRCGWSRRVPSAGCSALSTPTFGGGRGGSQPAPQRRPLPGAPPGGRNHDRSRAAQPGIESGVAALRLDAGGRAARRREHPSGGQRADVPGSSTRRSPPPIRPTSRDRCAAMRWGRGGSAPWPWKWTPAPASSPRFRWCRSRRGRIGNRWGNGQN